MTRRERDNIELGTVAGGHLLCENATLAISRHRHIRLIGGMALSIRWGRWLEIKP